MGFSTSVANLIFFLGFLSIAGILIGTGLDYQRLVDRAEKTQEEMQGELERTSIIIKDKDVTGSTLTLSVNNDGEEIVDLDEVTLLLNGELVTDVSLTIDGDAVTLLQEDETVTVTVGNAYLNASVYGGDPVLDSSFPFSSPSRICYGEGVHVSDGTVIRSFDSDGEYLWSRSSGLTSVSDIDSSSSTLYILGNDRVMTMGTNGSTSASELINNSGIDNGTRLILSARDNGSPYLIVLENDGDILRFDIDGSSRSRICVNGTNVNWTSPVDLISGNGSFRLLDGDGKIYNITYSGYDSLAGSISLSTGEEPVAADSTGYEELHVLVLLRGYSSSRVVCFNMLNSTKFDLIKDLGTGQTDISAGPGLYLLDGSDRSFSGITLGTMLRIALISGYTFMEVI